MSARTMAESLEVAAAAIAAMERSARRTLAVAVYALCVLIGHGLACLGS